MQETKIESFLVERFMNAYETKAELNLAETCVDPFTLQEFLAFVGREDFVEKLGKTKMTYGCVEGSPELREGISSLYDFVDQENVLVTGGAIGANFLVFYSLVEPGDTVISVFPAYQQLYSVPESLGARVKLLTLHEESKWSLDIDELSELIDTRTKLIVVNNPHNPTGNLIDSSDLRKICTIAEETGAFLLCDETYRGLYVNPDDFCPSAADLSENAIVTGSFSKAFSLAGLRLGWVVGNSQVIKECKGHRDYTTISNSIIDDALASLAVKNVDRIFQRSLGIVRTNHRILSNWIDSESLVKWVPSRAGSVAFVKCDLKMTSEDLCARLVRDKSTLLVPGSCFGMEGYLRIGYGCETKTLERGIQRFRDFLAR